VEQKDKDFSKFRHEIVDKELLARLSNAAIRVYLVILRYANYDTGSSYPTVKTISKLSGVNRNRVSSATRELVLHGLIDKSRARKNFAFRNLYRVIKYPKIVPDIIPRNTDKCRKLPRDEDGKFKPIPRNTDNDIPHSADDLVTANRDSNTFPLNTDKKENLETKKRDKVLETAGSASARPKGQAEPASNSNKSLKAFSKETINGFIKDKGLAWLKDYLRKQGYDEKEIQTLDAIKGGGR
jgi:hypothetical protein